VSTHSNGQGRIISVRGTDSRMTLLGCGCWYACNCRTRSIEGVIVSLTFPNSNVLTPVHGLFGIVNQTVSSDLHAVTSIIFGTHDEILFLKFASRFMQRAALHLLKSSVLTLKARACVV
jgi:hypothetical protein